MFVWEWRGLHKWHLDHRTHAHRKKQGESVYALESVLKHINFSYIFRSFWEKWKNDVIIASRPVNFSSSIPDLIRPSDSECGN